MTQAQHCESGARRLEELSNSSAADVKAAYVKRLDRQLAHQLERLPAEHFRRFFQVAADAILQAEKLDLRAELVTGKLPSDIAKQFEQSFPGSEGVPIGDLESSHANCKDRSRYFAFIMNRNKKNVGFAQGFRVGNGFLIEYVTVDRANRQEGLLKNFICFTAFTLAESRDGNVDGEVDHIVFDSKRVGQGDSFQSRAETVVRNDMIFGPMGATEYLVDKHGLLHPLYLEMTDQERDESGTKNELQTMAFSSHPVPRIDDDTPGGRTLDVEAALIDAIDAYENRPGLDVPEWKRRNASEARSYARERLYDANGRKADVAAVPLHQAPSHIEMAKHFPEFAREVIDNFHLNVDASEADSERGRQRIARMANARFIRDLTLLELLGNYKRRARKIERRLAKDMGSSVAELVAPGATTIEKLAVLGKICTVTETERKLVKTLVKSLRSHQAIQYRLAEASKDQTPRRLDRLELVRWGRVCLHAASVLSSTLMAHCRFRS